MGKHDMSGLFSNAMSYCGNRLLLVVRQIKRDQISYEFIISPW